MPMLGIGSELLSDALLGLSKISSLNGDYSKSLQLLEQAKKNTPENEKISKIYDFIKFHLDVIKNTDLWTL